MTKFMREREALPLTRIIPIDHNYWHCSSANRMYLSRQTIDVLQVHGEHFDAAFFKQLYEIGDRVDAKIPMIPDVKKSENLIDKS